RVAMEKFGDEAAVLVAEELVLDRQEICLLDLACHAHCQDFKSVRRAAGGGRIGPAIAYLVIEAVHLIAVDMAVGAEEIAVEQPGIGKCPMFRPIDRKAARAARRAAAPARIDALGRVEAERL